LRVDGDDEDSLIESMIGTATEYVQTRTRRQIAEAEYTLYLDAFPPEIRLTPAPLSDNTAAAVTVTYYDTGGTERTLSASDYTVDDKQEPAVIVPAYGKSWPATYAIPNAVSVVFTSGYAAELPAPLGQAILMHVANQYESRGDAETVPDLRMVDAICKLYEVPYVA
jgi:uncharacterized phiE125 gp8 family phage protein